MVRPRRDVDVDADVAVGERRDRLLVDAAGRDGGERDLRHRDFLTEPRLGRQSVGGSQLRVREDARVRVLLQQPIVQAGQVREEDVALAQVGELFERQPAWLVDVDLAGDPDVVARRQNLDAVLLEPRAIDLQQFDVDDDFGARLVDRRDQP